MRQAHHSHTLRQIGVASSFTVTEPTPGSAPGPVRFTVLAVNLLNEIPGHFTARGSTFRAPGKFVAIRYRVTNLASGTIVPYHVVGDHLTITGAELDAILQAGLFDPTCSVAGPSFAVDQRLASPFTPMTPHQTEVTAAVYPLPQAAPVNRLAWTAIQLGITVPFKSPAVLSLAVRHSKGHGAR